MKKYFGKLASAALVAAIVGGGGFSINASASELETNAINTHEISEVSALTLNATDEFGEFTATVTFEPALGEGSIIRPMDVTLPLAIGSAYFMDGSNWLLLYGSNVVSLSGNKATMIGYGTAQVQAFKSNGAVLGVYTFVVQR